MKVKYLGPRDRINVGGFGEHIKGKVEDYPEDMALDLVLNSKRQHFEAVDGLPEGAEDQAGKGESEQGDVEPEDTRTVKELMAELEARGIEVPKKARKAELIKLLEGEEARKLEG